MVWSLGPGMHLDTTQSGIRLRSAASRKYRSGWFPGFAPALVPRPVCPGTSHWPRFAAAVPGPTMGYRPITVVERGWAVASMTEARLKIGGAVATITFVSESGVNVMSQAALEKLAAVIEQVRQAERVRWTVLRAEGKVFIAGADIKEMADFDAATARKFSLRGNAVMDALASLPSITVAALHGAALGGGCEIALACDFRIATEKVKIGLPETSLGLIPGWGGTQRSLRLLGPTWARRLVWSATPLAARQALEIGLIDQLVASTEELASAVTVWCRSFVRGGPRAIAAAKRALLSGDEPTAFGDCFGQDESREGTTAFVEKRAANWMEE